MEERLIKIENRVNILIVLVAIILFCNLIALGGGSSSKTYDADENTETNSAYDVSSFKEITASDVKNLPANEVSVLYIGREGCSWCINMLPNLKQAQSEYGYTTYYIDIAKIIDYSTGATLDEEAYNTLIKLKTVDEEENVMSEFGSTPMMLLMKNNKIIASQIGYSDYDTFAKVLEKGGLSKK